MRMDAPRTLILAAVLACFGFAFAQDTASLINQALDQPVKIQFDSVLPEAMSAIGRKTGVRIEAEQAVWDLLPWGQQTNISAKIENQTLRQAMDVITHKLGLTYVLKPEALELQPIPALRRVGRRATIQELQALDLLTSRSLGIQVDRLPVKDLVATVDARLTEAKSPFAIEYRPGDAVRVDKQVFIPRNATLAEALESLAKETPLTWYPWGKTILIVPKEEQVRNQLAKTITMRFAGVDVAQVLSELSQRAGLRFEIEPGALQRVPADVRNVHLMLDNSSISQALDTIAGFTGLAYVVTPRGVYIWNQSYQTPAGARDPIVGMLSLPDSNMQIVIHESQVPPDMKEYFKFKREKELERIRRMMTEQGFSSTAPATTRPATGGSPATPASSPANEDL